MDDRSATEAATAARSELVRELVSVISGLRGTYAAHWERVPTGCGALAARASDILAGGIVPVHPGTIAPVRLLQELEPFVRFTIDTAAELLDQTSLLGEALGADLATMSVLDLRELACAVFSLRAAPAPDPSWARPQAAASAAVAVDALGEEVRIVAVAHQQLQREFTDDVWNLSVLRRYNTIDHWWQWRARGRVRRALAVVSRSGRPTGDVRRLWATLHEITELRARMEGAWAPLRAHLGSFAATPIPDVDGATTALTALQQLQAALGSNLDPGKLAELSAADAFVAKELTAPAESITDAIAAWVGLAKRNQSADPLAFTVRELDEWARLAGKSLAVLRFLHESMSPLRTGVRSVAETFDDAIARDRVAFLRRQLGITHASDEEHL